MCIKKLRQIQKSARDCDSSTWQEIETKIILNEVDSLYEYHDSIMR